MRHFFWIFLSIFLPYLNLQASSDINGKFLAKRKQLEKCAEYENCILVASTGLSGSTLLTESLKISAPKRPVCKTHLFPPISFLGKIIFIYSNPDRVAEAALNRSLRSPAFGADHFRHMEDSDLLWLNKVGSTDNQTESDNMLAYDALRITLHLKKWLIDLKRCPAKVANVMAVKYEHLWDKEVIEEMKKFLGISRILLPTKKMRGHSLHTLNEKERQMRLRYNLGTEKYPRYVAYDEARTIWMTAPPVLYLSLSSGSKGS